ncbi:DHA2 family efflux MFS transporter permease subunit [Sneathiella glossodoripedis]|uniref:DHA2 family efflux MFS transporter permease subunit n=1 Tax=Sneathiella glossodoripedis TaxID=418853 RepID=UPI00046EA42E|nr:DHA2 family efflux MFS transporter permease subunit [Sneathiella glossodoripedis]
MTSARETRLQEKFGPAYKWMAGFSVILGLLTAIFSSTMVNVALTDIMATFDITQASAQWMSTAFLSASCVAMLTTAWLMNNFGARSTFLIAIAAFSIGSLIGWQSINYEILVSARILQGIGAGILQPLSMSLIFMLFPAEMRGRAMGLFGMGVVIGPAMGPVIGGIITDSLDWHTTFAVVLPLALLAGLLGYLLLPDKSENRPIARFNFQSLILISACVACLLSGLSNSQFFPFSSLLVFPYLLIAAITLVLFLIRDVKSTNPLVQLALFKDPRICASAIIGALTSAGMFSSFYTIPLFSRTVQQTSATDAGLLLLPAGLLLVIVFPIVGRLIDRMPSYPLILIGQVTFVCSTVALSYATADTSFLYLAGWIIISRIGLGFIMPSNSTYSLSIVQAHQVPDASGALNFLRILGGTIGVNLTALLITARSDFHLNEAMQVSGQQVLTEVDQIRALTLVFEDVFLVTASVFALSLLPALYLTYSFLTATKKPR